MGPLHRREQNQIRTVSGVCGTGAHRPNVNNQQGPRHRASMDETLTIV